MADGERVKRSSPEWERLASDEVGLSHTRAIHGGTQSTRSSILVRLHPLPTEPRPCRVYVPISTNLFVRLQPAESEGFDPPRPCCGRPSLSKRVQYQALPTLLLGA